jgi:broad specificity phosphatase PhoE
VGLERIYLARHGQSETNRERRLCGQLDPALTTLGIEQSRQLARVLADVPLRAIFTSTLQRTVQMAAPIARARGVASVALAGLNELALGVLQGRFRDERDPQAQALWRERKADPARFRAPGGESFQELEARVLAALDQMLESAPSGAALIVGHRESNRALLKGLLGWSTERALQAKLRNYFVYDIDVAARTVVRTISLREEDAGQAYDGFRT